MGLNGWTKKGWIMSELEEVIREKLAEIKGMLAEARTQPVPWTVSDATYYERWALVRDNLLECLGVISEREPEQTP